MRSDKAYLESDNIGPVAQKGDLRARFDREWPCKDQRKSRLG